MARSSSPPSKPAVAASKDRVGTYQAYGPDGEVFWVRDGFRIGHDQVPLGASIGMVAGTVTDPKTGEIIHKWDPHHTLG